MLKYIPIAFIAITLQSLSNTASTGMNLYLEQGDLDKAHSLLTDVWLFGIGSIIMFALIAILALFDLKKLGK
jgi:hypothetical protein